MARTSPDYNTDKMVVSGANHLMRSIRAKTCAYTNRFQQLPPLPHPGGLTSRMMFRVTEKSAAKRNRPGRPAHSDDPPKIFSTTLPESVHELLSDIAKRQKRPKSEILAEAVRAYARRFSE